MRRRSVCVFCASSEQAAEIYNEAARELVRQCLLCKLSVVYGAGAVGIMGIVADGYLQACGDIVGVIPEFMVQRGWHHRKLEHLEITPDMGSRKQKMRELSDGIIVLPGGCGTLEELLECITQKQLGLYKGPIIILNTAGFYDALLQQLEECVDHRMMRPEHTRLWAVARTPEEAVRLFMELPDEQQPLEKRVLK